jgi:hypothetical protein
VIVAYVRTWSVTLAGASSVADAVVTNAQEWRMCRLIVTAMLGVITLVAMPGLLKRNSR